MKINKPPSFRIGDKVWINNGETIHIGWKYSIMKFLPNNKVEVSSPSGLGRNMEVNIKDIALI